MTSTLLTPESQALIGTIITGEVPIIIRDFQRWAAAVGDLNPLYFDADFARAHGHPDVVMPPLFASRRISEVTRLDLLKPDGTVFGPDEQMPLPPRRMAGTDEWQFLASVYGGDMVHWHRELIGLEEKQGRSGPMVQIIWETRYSRSDGILASVNTNILLALPI